MGQKVHPIGFRVGITKKHQSQWFARFTKYSYAQSILEDRLLRNTLISVANEALNSNLIKKRDSALSQNPIIPKITHIKIERGLIPYEIGIQIHAENCQKLKSSLNNIKINRELLSSLRDKKTRRFLMSLGKHQSSLQSSARISAPSLAVQSDNGGLSLKEESSLPTVSKNKKVTILKSAFKNSTLMKKKLFCFSSAKPSLVNTTFTSIEKQKASFGGIRKASLFSAGQSLKFKKGRSPANFLSMVYKKKKMIIKRLQKRQEIRQRYRRLMLKGLFVQKKGKVISCISSLFFSKKQIKKTGYSLSVRGSTVAKKNKSNSLAQRDQKVRFSKRLAQKNGTLANASLSYSSPATSVGKFAAKGGKKAVRTLGLKGKNNLKKPLKGVSGGSSALKEKLILKGSSGQQKIYPTNDSVSFAKNIGNRIKKKFVSLFLNKINKRFLKQLKEQMTQWNKSLKQHRQEQIKLYGALRFAPLGYNQKWSLKRLNLLKNKPLFKLLKLIKIIERKSLIKLETLRKDFIAFGTISKSETLSYYQIINFLKNLKIMSLKVKKEQKRILVKTLTKDKSKSILTSENQAVLSTATKDLSLIKPNSPLKGKYTFNYGEDKNQASFGAGGMLNKKLNPILPMVTSLTTDKKQNYSEVINNECRKNNFIEYLKDVVKKHRTNNLFYYLSTISEARKNLKKIKQFTKLHSQFLFGSQLSVGSLTQLNKTDDNSKNVVFNKIKNVLDLTSKKSNLQKELSYYGSPMILEQLEKQRTMYKQLAELTPKISIKFYSVKSENVKIKASVISDSIIDALEKRKAFRKVIKDAKENLMRNSKVKGVKIQVSGRLNGAEIARTEWVRSGRVPLQTLRANLDYSYKTAKTIYGILGIKVWVFKGYTKLV